LARKLKDHGDEYGPAIDHLRNVKGKRWKQIAKSAGRPGGKDLGF